MTTSKLKENKNIEEKVPRLCVPTRYIVALMASMGIFVQFLLKFSVSVAIVAMVKTTSSGATNVTSMDACPNTATISTGTSAKEGEFDWSGTMQGFVLSSFYYGYICTQLLGGRLSEMFGAKLVMGPGILLAGILSLLAPIAARWHVAAFATIRILVGACVGVFFPALQNLFSKWFPPEEHQRTSGIMYSCMYLSNIISMSVSGVLSGISWDLVFYVYGGCAILWSIPWLFIIYNSPEEHPTISPEELLYITKSSDSEKGHGETLKPVPWKAILTSPPVWAAISVQSGGAYVTYTFMSELPTYSKNVLHFDVQGSGLISSLPYIFAWISCVSCGFISQWLQKKEYLTRIMAYRIFNGICCIGPSICLLLVTLVGCNTAAVVALLVTTQFLYGSYFGGSFMNSLDLGINYAGSISGIGLTIVNSMGIFSAQVAGLLTDGEQSTKQWNKVFYIAMGVIIVPFVIFMIFGSTEEQEWNKQERDEERSKEVRRLERKKKMSMEHIPNI